MQIVQQQTASSAHKGNALYCLLCAAIILLLVAAGSATEKGASVYPAGVETVMPGMTPPPGGTVIYEYTTVYSANELDDGRGKSALPGFKLLVFANAFKVTHNWGVHILGGTLSSNVAVPFVDEHVTLPFGKFSQFGLGNVCLSPLGISYHRENWHFYYEADGYLPGGGYDKSNAVNIGQHNFAAAPVSGISYLPFHGRTELSSKLQYIVNFTNPDTNYRSGNEFVWEYDAMQEVSGRAALGVNGYFYRQTTDDLLSGTAVAGGNRGRDLAVGPEFRFRLGKHAGFALKYERDILVQNRPRGNAFWFQMALPLH